MKASDGMRLYSSLPKFEDARTWAEIDLGALKDNYIFSRDRVWDSVDRIGASRPEPICVVKADAYGHGARGAVPVFIAEGCRFFAVSAIEEAVEVRNICRNRRCDARIIILGVTLPELAETLAEYDVIATLPSLEHAMRLSAAAVAAGVRVRAHVKIDTGMNRLGFPACRDCDIEETINGIARCVELGGLKIEGIFTHFAEADDGADEFVEGANLKQVKRFGKVVDGLEALGIDVGFRHVCNSAAAIRFPELALDGVRLGISLYGSRPSGAFSLPLRSVMRLKTKISHIHTLPAGEKVSYGGAFSASEDRVIATLPIGYADGFLRAYGGSTVRISSKLGDFDAPVVGRICMDQCMVDITDGLDFLPRVGDEVTLFGDSPDRLYRLAELADTIPYEVLCAVSSRVIRMYI